jgi:hypothetical protein
MSCIPAPHHGGSHWEAVVSRLEEGLHVVSLLVFFIVYCCLLSGFLHFMGEERYLLGEVDCSIVVALHHVMMLSVFTIAGEDLGFWIRPRSTIWFSQFVVSEFEDGCWVQCFRMTKRAVFSLAEMLCLQIQRCDTRYRLAIPMLIRICYTLFKLAQGCSIFICS